MPRRRARNDPLWTVIALAILVFLLITLLRASLAFGGFFLVMFIVTLVLYVRRYNFHRLIKDPRRIIIIWVAQVLIFSIGDLLIAAKDSLLEGSLLTALILFLTYLYLRYEAKKLQKM